MTAKKKSVTKKTTAKKSTAKRAPRRKKQNITRVALVIDRSGSMEVVRQGAFSGINEQIKTLKANAKTGGETFVTYVQFDGIIETLFENKPAAELQEITFEQFQPRGSTAMYDAVMTAIARLQHNVVDTPDTAYLVIVISDGYENASRQYSAAQVAAKIKELQDGGRWTFSYMLSNQDLSVVTKQLGLDVGNVSAFTYTNTGTAKAFAMTADSTTNYLSSRAQGVLRSANFYSQDDSKKKKEEKK